MTLLDKAKVIWPNHIHRLQPMPNKLFARASDIVYQLHVREYNPTDGPHNVLDWDWTLVAQGNYDQLQGILDTKLIAARRAMAGTDTDHTY